MAFTKIKEIVKAQDGNPNIDSENLKPGKFFHEVRTNKNGVVRSINSKNLTIIAKMLGAPKQKGAGIFLNKKIGEKALEKEVLYTLYSENMYNLKQAKDYIVSLTIVKI